MNSRNVHEKMRILRNKTAKKILSSCSDKAKSIKEISKTQGIPLAKCYRVATELEDNGYIEVVNKVHTGGKEICLYKTMINLKFISYDEGNKKVKIDPEDTKKKDSKVISS